MGSPTGRRDGRIHSTIDVVLVLTNGMSVFCVILGVGVIISCSDDVGEKFRN